MTLSPLTRRLGVLLVVACCAGGPSAARAAGPPTLDLDTLSASDAEQMLQAGSITSVQLTQAYIDRINALNKSGPGLNAVTQFNKDALVEAAKTDDLRAKGVDLGPAMGLPILLKDIIDSTPMYTSAGNFSLRNSFPAEDSGVSSRLRKNGVVVLGKLGLSEFANFFGNQPSGFSNLTGQVLNAIDADQNPSGSSSGSGSAAAGALASLTIGTETSGSIISPSMTQGVVGLRPTVGLVPGYGIAPIYASQDTAGPIERTVSDAARTMQALIGPAGSDPTTDNEAKEADQEYKTVFGDDYIAKGIIPAPPKTTPNYMSALDTNFVKGLKIGYTGTPTAGSTTQIAIDALTAAGANVVPAPTQTTATTAAVNQNYEAHKTIDAYYAHLGPNAPIQSMDDELADNFAHPLEALKFGNATHQTVDAADITPGGANETSFRTTLAARKQAQHTGLDNVFNNNTPNDTSDDFAAVIGSLANTPAAGYPQITIPLGYVATTRRTQAVSVFAGAYGERNLLGVGYAIEQGTKLRQPAAVVDPSFYRCAPTVASDPEPFSGRGHCNPSYASIMSKVGTVPDLGFSLETESASSLQDRMSNGTLSAETLTKAYLARIAETNANGPALQAVREVDAQAAIDQAKALDAERASGDVRGPLHGIPVLVDDTIDAKGFPTTGGSIALQDATPANDSKIVARLKSAGAIVLGKTNVTELNGLFDANIPEGYSSLGGQVLTPFDTDKTPAGSSGGSAAATSAGLAAMTVGLETSTDTAQLIAPGSVAGVVALKPTVGRVSRTGVLGVAKSQDSPGPIAKTVRDVANALQVMAVRDTSDSATTAAPAPGAAGTDYTSGLTTTALNGKRIGVIANTTVPYPAAITATQGAGATTVTRTPATFTTRPSIIAREFKRDVNAYLANTPGGAGSLQGIIDYDNANPQEGLKYQQGELVAAQATTIDSAYTGTPASGTTPAVVGDRDQGITDSRNYIDGLLNNGTPADTTDDVEAMLVPVNSTLINIADRAGYPVLEVPAGYGATASGNGHDPIGVALVGTAYSEAKLLADGYAFEQATKVRVAPSLYNPSMWRCVPGSAYFHPYKCHPGDLQYSQAFTAVPAAAATATATATATAAAAATATPTATAANLTVPKLPVSPGLIATLTKGLQKEALSTAVTKKVGRKTHTLSFTESFLETGTAKYTLRIKIGKHYVTLGRKTVKVTNAGNRKVKITLSKKARKRLRRHRKAKVTLKTTFKPKGTYALPVTTVRKIKRG